MNRTRREFLGSASRAVACGIASSAWLGCASRPSAEQHAQAIATPAQRRSIRPPVEQVLFIAGQDAGQLSGYLDNMPMRPGGFTLYCSVSSAPDFNALTDFCNRPALKDSVLHLSIAWVSDFDIATKDNNRLITTGAFDRNIDALAHWCAAQDRPILMRIGFEFDRGMPGLDFHYDPAYFAQAFRRIVDRLRAAGADNVASVLASSNAPGYSPVLTTEKFSRFYPGDDYVDWLGCSMFWPDGIDHVMLSEARKRNKPVLIAESTPMKYNIAKGTYYPAYVGFHRNLSAQEIWNGWHQPMLDFINANRDVIAAWHYIAADWSTDPMWRSVPFFTNCDARPWANADFLKLWNEHINSPPFLHASPTLFQKLGFTAQS